MEETIFTSEPLQEIIELNQKEFFTKVAVEKFRKEEKDIEKSRLRHYNQLITQFDDSATRFVLSKLKIPIQARATIYGGFTGEFADSLRRVGMSVVFTDPLEEWVEQAMKKGFISFKLAVQQIPKELIERTDLFASFECYPDLIGYNEFYYPLMRFLTVEYGILFAESKATVTSMHEEAGSIFQELGTFRRWLRPLWRVYGIQRKAIKTKYLNFYHIFGKPETRKLLNVDCQVSKAVYDTFASGYRVTTVDTSKIAAGTSLDNLTVDMSIKRLRELSDSINAPYIKSFPFMASNLEGSLFIGSKRFYFSV
jgi:hypothetical protein